MEDENAQNLLNNDENNNGEKEENKIEIQSDNQNDNNKDEENNKNEIILNEEKNNINEIEINKEIDKNINQKIKSISIKIKMEKKINLMIIRNKKVIFLYMFFPQKF